MPVTTSHTETHTGGHRAAQKGPGHRRPAEICCYSFSDPNWVEICGNRLKSILGQSEHEDHGMRSLSRFLWLPGGIAGGIQSPGRWGSDSWDAAHVVSSVRDLCSRESGAHGMWKPGVLWSSGGTRGLDLSSPRVVIMVINGVCASRAGCRKILHGASSAEPFPLLGADKS